MEMSGPCEVTAAYFLIGAILVQFDGVASVINFNAAAIYLSIISGLTLCADATTIIITNTNDNGPGSLRPGTGGMRTMAIRLTPTAAPASFCSPAANCW